MKFNRLLLFLPWFLIVGCLFFTGGNTSPPSVTEAEEVTEEIPEEVAEEVAEPKSTVVLPASVYFLTGEDGNASLWRVEVDGVTKSSIKDCCIRDYAVSPTTGQIAYMTNEEKLIISDADGEETIEVDLDEVNYPQEFDSALAWSPDGTQLALGGENGLWIYMPASESLVQISGTAEYTTFIRPLAYDAWSPSGGKILIMAYRPNADVNEIGMIPILSGEVKMASMLTGGRAIWAPDSESFYISSNIYGITGILPSLIVVTTDDLDHTALIKAELTEDGHGRYLEGAQVGPDDLLYYFYGEGPIDHETKTTDLSMYRSNRDGITDRVPLRTDTYFGISEILWAEDMSLAIIATARDFPNTQAGTITILSADGSIPAIETPFKGYELQWGLAEENEKTSQPTDASSLPATTPIPDLILWRKVRSPLFPSNWAPTVETVWVRYTFAYGSNPTELMDSEYVTKPLSKTECRGDVVKTIVLSNKMAQAAIQGVIPLDEPDLLLLQNEMPVPGDCVKMTQLPDPNLPETKELLEYYRAWFKYNGAFLDLIRKDHTDFIDWVMRNE